MAEGQGVIPSATQDKKGGATVQNEGNGESSIFSAPERYGNAAGETIQNTMAPVGNTVGKGLETVTKPVGGVVDGVVGGLMRTGGAFGETLGVVKKDEEGKPSGQERAKGKEV